MPCDYGLSIAFNQGRLGRLETRGRGRAEGGDSKKKKNFKGLVEEKGRPLWGEVGLCRCRTSAIQGRHREERCYGAQTLGGETGRFAQFKKNFRREHPLEKKKGTKGGGK